MRRLAVPLLTLCLSVTACSSADPDGKSSSPSETSFSAGPTADATGAAIEEMCERQRASFRWVFPVRPEYGDAEIDESREGVAAERERVQRSGAASDEVLAYLDELDRLVEEFGNATEEADPARRYSGLVKSILRVDRRARAAELPHTCSLGLEPAEIRDLRFQRKAAIACTKAYRDMVDAPTRAAAGSGSRLERFIRLQGAFGRIYLRLARKLAKAATAAAHPDAEALVETYRRAGRARLASEAGLSAGNDAKATRAGKRYRRQTARASELTRSLGLPFCDFPT